MSTRCFSIPNSKIGSMHKNTSAYWSTVVVWRKSTGAIAWIVGTASCFLHGTPFFFFAWRMTGRLTVVIQSWHLTDVSSEKNEVSLTPREKQLVAFVSNDDKCSLHEKIRILENFYLLAWLWYFLSTWIYLMRRMVMLTSVIFKNCVTQCEICKSFNTQWTYILQRGESKCEICESLNIQWTYILHSEW